MKIKPLSDRVLVIKTEDENRTKGGIIIPDTAREKPQKGKVVAVGPGKMGDNGNRIPLDVKVGDKVIFSKYAGNEIKIDNTDHVFMKEADILAVVE